MTRTTGRKLPVYGVLRPQAQSLDHLVTQPLGLSAARSLVHSVTHVVTRSFNHSVTQPLVSVTRSLDHSVSQSLGHSVAWSLGQVWSDDMLVYTARGIRSSNTPQFTDGTLADSPPFDPISVPQSLSPSTPNPNKYFQRFPLPAEASSALLPISCIRNVQ
eukprot:8552936-Pyramimonas_sp.AAC.2